MKNAIITLLAVAGLALSACGSSGGKGPFIYAADGRRTTGGNLYKIYVDTLEVEIVGPVKSPLNDDYLFGVSAMVMGPDGLLYAFHNHWWQDEEEIEFEGESFENAIITIDPETGSVNFLAGNDSYQGVKGFYWIDDTLVGVQSYGTNDPPSGKTSQISELVYFDPETGEELVPLDDPDDSNETYGSALLYDGEIFYKIVENVVYTINTETGELDEFTELNTDNDARTFMNVIPFNGKIYALTSIGDDAEVPVLSAVQLATIDLDSGEVELLGTLPGGIHTIAAPN